ncbi:MAG TPA: trypsin-like peptidase domain-containing protein [Tepidisphaeraceae bacterium]|jgi:serine protease Do|nr:trypsin-like peptidase domain-containing protein [Tepidisphaeraceae bacterium]
MGCSFLRGRCGAVLVLLGASGFVSSCSVAHAPLAGVAVHAAPTTQFAHNQSITVSDNFGIEGLEQRFEKIAEQLSPSVVAISATEVRVDAADGMRTDDICPDRLASMLDTVDRTVGTGFVIDSSGYIVTNEHVVSAAQQLWVTTDDHHVYPAIVVGSDPRADVAVLKIPAKGLPAVQWADGLAVRRGQWTMALGNPYGLASGGEMCASVGVVSATGRSLPKLAGKEDRIYSNLIQTTAQINPGNSGGPLFDLDGRVIGINTAVILPQRTTNGIGFAIPASSHLHQVIARLQAGRPIVYSFLGVRVTSPTPHERRDAGMPKDSIQDARDPDGVGGGALVQAVENDSPAEIARLQAGDIISAFNGVAVSDSDQFVQLVGQAPANTPIPATVYRHGNARQMEFTLRPRPISPEAVTRNTQRLHWRGLILGPVPTDALADPAMVAGLEIFGVEPNSPLLKRGARQGEVLTTVAGKPVHDLVQLQQVLNDTPADQCDVQFTAPKGQYTQASVAN